MRISEFLNQLRSLGIEVYCRQGELVCNAPKHVITQDIAAAIRERKAEILDFLQPVSTQSCDGIAQLQVGLPSAPTLFLIPPADYRQLPHALDPSLSVAAVLPPPPGTPSDITGNIERLATYYRQQVEQYQPHPPYNAIGYCIGGVVAFEMARQWLNLGKPVDTLITIDLATPPVLEQETAINAIASWGQQHLSQFRQQGPDYIIERSKPRLREIREQVEIATRQSLGQPLSAELSLANAYRTAMQALESYTPQPYSGDMIALVSEEIVRAGNTPEQSWARCVDGSISVQRITGEHHSLFELPHVTNLAALIQAAVTFQP